MTEAKTEEEFVVQVRGLWQEVKPEEAVLTGPRGQSSIPQLPTPGATSQKASEKPTSQLGDDLVSLSEGNSSSLTRGSSSVASPPPPPIIASHHP